MKSMKKIVSILISVLVLLFSVPSVFAVSDNVSHHSYDCNDGTASIVYPENFSQDGFRFNKTTDEEYLKLAEFLTDEDMMKYFYGIPLSFQNQEDALFGLNRNKDGSAISTTGKEAVNYTIRCAEMDNAIIGQVGFGHPHTGTVTTYGDHGKVLCKTDTADMNVSYFIGKEFQGHHYAYKAVKTLIDAFYQSNEESELEIIFGFQCDPENIASLKTIEKLGAVPLPEENTTEYRYYKESVSDTMCEVKIEQYQNKKLCNVTTSSFPKSILHKCFMDLKEGECWTIQERAFYYSR